MTHRRTGRRDETRDALVDRLEATERRLEQLERATSAVAREAGGVTLAGACPECRRSLLLVTDGVLTCPACSYGRSL